MKTRQNKNLFIQVLFVACLGFAFNAVAQDLETEELSSSPAPSSSKTSAASKEKTLKIHFDDELVKGKQSMPEAEYIFTRAQFNYKRMIRLREDFIPEVQKGKDEFRGKH